MVTSVRDVHFGYRVPLEPFQVSLTNRNDTSEATIDPPASFGGTVLAQLKDVTSGSAVPKVPEKKHERPKDKIDVMLALPLRRTANGVQPDPGRYSGPYVVEGRTSPPHVEGKPCAVVVYADKNDMPLLMYELDDTSITYDLGDHPIMRKTELWVPFDERASMVYVFLGVKTMSLECFNPGADQAPQGVSQVLEAEVRPALLKACAAGIGGAVADLCRKSGFATPDMAAKELETIEAAKKLKKK